MDIIRGTTPTIQYTFSVVPVADITTAILTIKRGNVLASQHYTHEQPQPEE